MESLWSIYHSEVPGFILEMANTPAMLRLKGIGMHCGCEYTRFPQYVGVPPYSRWTHSVGVALIVWHFTEDTAQTIAGLLHDVATPVFAHVIDFLHGDYIAQESTEDETAAIIEGSAQIMSILGKLGLTAAQVSDYHMYPVADNDSPQLSADRLEYTLGNALGHGLANLDQIREVYRDLVVAANKERRPEIQFRNAACARLFAEWSLTNSRVYSCDENRFSMQALADLLRSAMEKGVVSETDLHTVESAVIEKICSDAQLRAEWERYRRYCVVRRSSAQPKDGYWVKLDAKRRCIDPMVAERGRVTALYPEYQEALKNFRSESYDYWMSAAED